MSDAKRPEENLSEPTTADARCEAGADDTGNSGLDDVNRAIEQRQLLGFLEERSMPIRYIWYFGAFLIAFFLLLLILF